MPRRLPAALLLVVVLLAGCGQKQQSSLTEASADTSTQAVAPEAAPASAEPTGSAETTASQRASGDAQRVVAASGSEARRSPRGATRGGQQVGPGPVGVRITAIGVDAPLVRLGLNDDASLEVPADYDDAGWYSGGPAPGATGPAVVAGHVSSRQGPAVFADLGRLERGDLVEVVHDSGKVSRFRVERVEQYPKDQFPTEAVYGPQDEPVLRLITCGGDFDRSSGHYRDNVIVYARLA